MCEEVGRGLLALHERSIVHRDLKPHNVLFTEAMRTKLSDMGLCKRLTTDQTSYDSAGPGTPRGPARKAGEGVARTAVGRSCIPHLRRSAESLSNEQLA